VEVGGISIRAVAQGVAKVVVGVVEKGKGEKDNG
jgi:hypothetical protein